MGSWTSDPAPPMAEVFNSAVAAVAIGAAWEVGLLDAVKDQKKVDVFQFAAENDLDRPSVQGLVAALAVVQVVALEQNTVVAGRQLEEAYRTKSLFHWLCLGSGGLFSRMQYVLRNEHRTGDFHRRDPAAIAHACHDINKQYFDPAFWAAMDGLDYPVQSVVDLGCGSGQRLMQILDRHPQASAIGIDVAGPAIQVAARDAVARGFGNRLVFREGDAREVSYRDEFEHVDLLTCFMMGHDFWPRDKCIATLQRLRRVFPAARRLLLGDATRILLDTPGGQQAVRNGTVPIFTLGFEVGHAMMGVYLPTIDEWEGVFAEGGWRCVKKHLIESLSLSVVFELEHA